MEEKSYILITRVIPKRHTTQRIATPRRHTPKTKPTSEETLSYLNNTRERCPTPPHNTANKKQKS